MSSPSDQALELLIEFKAQLGEAVKAREQLVELKRQATAMGVSTAGLDEEIKKADASLAQLSKKSLPETHEGMEIFNVHGREMHRLIHEMDKLMPGLGLTLRAAFNPSTLGIAAIVIIIEQLVKWFEASKKAAEELKKTLEAMPELAGLLGQTSGLAEAMEDAHLSTEKFFDGLQRAHDNAVTVNTVLEQTLGLLKRQTDAEDDIAKKQKERDLARLEFLHETKQLNDAQYIAAKAATEQDFRDGETARKLKLDQRVLNETSTAWANADLQKELLSRQVAEKENAARVAKLAADNAKKRAQDAQDNADKIAGSVTGVTVTHDVEKGIITGVNKESTPGLSDLVNTAKNKLPLDLSDHSEDWLKNNLDKYDENGKLKDTKTNDEIAKDFQLRNELNPDSTAVQAYIALTKKLAEAQAEEAKWIAIATAAKAEVVAAKEAALKPESDLAELKKKITELSTAADSLHKQVLEKRAALATDQHTAAVEKPIEQETDRFKEANELGKTPAGKMLHEAEIIAGRIGRGQGTQDDAAVLQSIISALSQHATDLPTSLATANRAAKDVGYSISLMNRFADMLQKLPLDKVGELEGRISDLESRFGSRRL